MSKGSGGHGSEPFWIKHQQAVDKALALGIVLSVVLSITFWAWPLFFPYPTERAQLSLRDGRLREWREIRSRGRTSFHLWLDGVAGHIIIDEAVLEQERHSPAAFRAMLERLPAHARVEAWVGPGVDQRVYGLSLHGRPILRWEQQQASLHAQAMRHAAIRYGATAMALLLGVAGWRWTRWKRRHAVAAGGSA